jgi:hypothetical protein
MVGYTWQSMCVRRSGSQWKVADVCWEEVLVLGVREDEREALVIHILMLVYLFSSTFCSMSHNAFLYVSINSTLGGQIFAFYTVSALPHSFVTLSGCRHLPSHQKMHAKTHIKTVIFHFEWYGCDCAFLSPLTPPFPHPCVTFLNV